MRLEQAIQSDRFSSQKHKAVLNILYSAWWIKTIISQELKTLGLTHEQYNVLRILKGKHPGEMCVKDIGGRMIERSSNVPRIIDRLVLKKFVDRSTSLIDKRETVITLTNEGILVLETSSMLIDKVFSASVTLDEENAQLLNELLGNMRINE